VYDNDQLMEVMPEEWLAQNGLTVVALYGQWDYSWNIESLVRRDSDGSLWYFDDGGCSCSGPFEGVTFPADFIPVNTQDALFQVEKNANGGDERRDFFAEGRKYLRERKES